MTDAVTATQPASSGSNEEVVAYKVAGESGDLNMDSHPMAITTEKQSEEWWWDESTKGTGPRPDWLPSDQTNASQYARSTSKSAKDLRVLLSKKGDVETAPDMYKLNVDKETLEKLEINDLTLNNFMTTAKDLKMTQATFDKLVGAYVAERDREFKVIMEEQAAEDAATKERLGPDALERVNRVSAWGKNLLPENFHQLFENTIQTADDVEMYEELMKHVTAAAEIPGKDSPVKRVESHEEIKAMLADPRYHTSAEFRQRVTDAYARLSKVN